MADQGSRPEASLAVPPAAAVPRLVGLDVARFVAVFWMFVAHIGPDANAGGVNRLLWLGDGREAALFAFLAGVSLTLPLGRTAPRGGGAPSRGRWKIVIRSAILLLLGVSLATIDTGVLVILPFFAAYFLVALPALRLSVRALVVWAGCWALAGPQLSFVLRAEWHTDYTNRVPDLHAFAEPGDMATTLLLSGTYPVLTWMPFVLAGMAVGKLDLTSPSVWRLLAGIGSGLALLGYGGSWLLLRMVDGQASLQASADRLYPAGTPGVSVLNTLEWFTGSVPTNDWIWLAVAQGHSGTSFEVVGATGVACAVLGTMLWMFRRGADLPPQAAMAAVGSMSLSVYTAHLVAGWSPLTPGPGSWSRLFAYTAVALVAAWLWARHLGKGPLERLTAYATSRRRPQRIP